MDIIKDIMGSKRGELMGALSEQGFSTEQAQGFLSESSNSIMSALQSDNVELGQADLQQQVGAIIGNIDLASLAQKVGISSDMAQKGLSSILPLIMQAVQDKIGDASGLTGLLGGDTAGGNIADMAKKFF